MLIVILLPATWSSLPDPTCYEPTSGRGPALIPLACLTTGLLFETHHPLPTYYLIHRTPPNPNFIHCPLGIESNGCLFTMDYSGHSGPFKALKISRNVITLALLAIESHCVGEDKNADGGQIVEEVADQVFIRFTLQHPGPRLTGLNTSSVGDSQPNENFTVPVHLNASLVRSGEINPSSMAFDR